MDDLEDLALVEPTDTAPSRVLVFRFVSALIRLIQSAERTAAPAPSRTPARARARSPAP